MTDITTPPPMPEITDDWIASHWVVLYGPNRSQVISGARKALTARDAIWSERVASLQAKLQGDPAVPVVAWSNGGDWTDEVPEAEFWYGDPMRTGEIIEYVRQSDHVAAIASLQARLDAAERDAARWRTCTKRAMFPEYDCHNGRWYMSPYNGGEDFDGAPNRSYATAEDALAGREALIDAATQEKP